jgi:hypothetical protein
MSTSKTITCLECDADIICGLEQGPTEMDDFLDIPDLCPACGEDPCPPIDSAYIEDFHSDG